MRWMIALLLTVSAFAQQSHNATLIWGVPISGPPTSNLQVPTFQTSTHTIVWTTSSGGISGATSGAIVIATGATTGTTPDPTNTQYVVSTAAPSAPTIVTQGSAGSTTHGYCAALRPVNANGPNSACSTTATINTSNATVNGTNYDKVTAPACSTAPSGTTADVYLVTAGGNLTTLGWLGNVACGAVLNVQGNSADACCVAPAADYTKGLYLTKLSPGTLIQMGPQTASAGSVFGLGLKPVDPLQAPFGLYSDCVSFGGWINDCPQSLAFNGANENPALPQVEYVNEPVFATGANGGQTEVYWQWCSPLSGTQTCYRPVGYQAGLQSDDKTLSTLTVSMNADNYTFSNRSGGTQWFSMSSSGTQATTNFTLNVPDGGALYLSDSTYSNASSYIGPSQYGLNFSGGGNGVGQINAFSIATNKYAARFGSGIPLGWASSTNSAGADSDTGLSRGAAGVVDVGNGTAGDTSGTLKFSTGVVSGNGAASAPALLLNGTCYTGGTGTTTWPMLLVQPSGTTSSSWNTACTMFGVNAVSGFGGRLIDLQINGTTQFYVDQSGHVNAPSEIISNQYLGPDISPNGPNNTFVVDHQGNSTVLTAVQMADGTFTNSSGVMNAVEINPTYNQTSTAGSTDLLINRIETARGSGAASFLVAQVGGTQKWLVDHTGVTGESPILTANLPACSTGSGGTGTVWRGAVYDATTPALGVALTGGGAVFATVHCSLTTGTYIVDGL
jgi:hypothetical protein